MTSAPIYEEKLNVNYPFIGAISLFVLAVGLVPSVILGGLWWLLTLYTVLTIGIIVNFFQMKIELFEEKLEIKYLLFYRKVIEMEKVQACSPYKISHPIRTYGGWGIRKGRDGTFALTQAFVNEGIKLETTGQTFVISSQTPETLCTAITSIKKS